MGCWVPSCLAARQTLCDQPLNPWKGAVKSHRPTAPASDPIPHPNTADNNSGCVFERVASRLDAALAGKWPDCGWKGEQKTSHQTQREKKGSDKKVDMFSLPASATPSLQRRSASPDRCKAMGRPTNGGEKSGGCWVLGCRILCPERSGVCD